MFRIHANLKVHRLSLCLGSRITLKSDDIENKDTSIESSDEFFSCGSELDEEEYGKIL